MKSDKTSTPVSPPVRATIPLVNADGLASYLQISPRSIRRLAAEGRIPKPLRIGGSPRWNLRLVERWVWAGCPASPRKSR
jgi:predicted DNA-binding transcriptional regulator AlpA